MSLSDVHFRSDKEKPLNWRDAKFEDNSPDDDAELPETPIEVIKLLGFDPLDD